MTAALARSGRRSCRCSCQLASASSVASLTPCPATTHRCPSRSHVTTLSALSAEQPVGACRRAHHDAAARRAEAACRRRSRSRSAGRGRVHRRPSSPCARRRGPCARPSSASRSGLPNTGTRRRRRRRQLRAVVWVLRPGAAPSPGAASVPTPSRSVSPELPPPDRPSTSAAHTAAASAGESPARSPSGRRAALLRAAPRSERLGDERLDPPVQLLRARARRSSARARRSPIRSGGRFSAHGFLHSRRLRRRLAFPA